MDIAIVAKHAGLPSSTLRYYEEIGLIRSVGRKGLRRLFNVSVLERLALIALGRSAGFSLAEIASMLGVEDKPHIDRQLLTAKADELNGVIQRLVAMRDGLNHAAACTAPSHLQCPTFRRLMGLAAAGELNADAAKIPSPKRRPTNLALAKKH